MTSRRFNSALTADLLRAIIAYDPMTSIITWCHRSPGTFKAGKYSADRLCETWNATWPGKVSGNDDGRGYIQIRINGERHRAHRIIWFYMIGEWPKEQIDHIDGNKSNNRWGNLREATNSQNHANKGLRADNKSGVKGVHFNPEINLWVASIKANKRSFHLGSFTTLDDAREAYRVAADRHFGEFARAA